MLKLSTKDSLKIKLSKGARIDPMGGIFKFGCIVGVAVASLGEAAGHGLWMDQPGLESCAALMAAEEKGLKCRATHPSYFRDGFGTYLGKLTNPSVNDGVVVADMNFSEVSTKSIMGNMAEYIMSMAKETPEDLGLSMHGDYDVAAMAAFMMANGATSAVLDQETGQWTAPGFKSPDPANTKNLPHIRLSSLTGVDTVDENALNPNGLLAKFSAKTREVDVMADLIAAELSGAKPIGIVAALATRKISLAAEVVNATSSTTTTTDASQYGSGSTETAVSGVVTRDETETEIVYTTTEKGTVVRTERYPKTPAPAVVVVQTEAAPAPADATLSKPAPQASPEMAAVLSRFTSMEADLSTLKTENASMKVELAKKKFEANTGTGIVPPAALSTEVAKPATGLSAKIAASAAAFQSGKK